MKQHLRVYMRVDLSIQNKCLQSGVMYWLLTLQCASLPFSPYCSDPTRLQVVYALLRAESGELCVGDLATGLGRDDTTISHQLRVLRNQQIVAMRKVGRIVYYRLVDEHIRLLLELGMTHTNETSTSSKEEKRRRWHERQP